MENDNRNNTDPVFIDTHSHLYAEEFDSDRDEAVQRAFDAGVTRLVLPAIDRSCHQALLDLHEKYADRTFPAAGLHPTSVNADWKDEMDFVTAELEKRQYYAIGEIGIDTYWSKEFLDEQCRVFEMQLELASARSLPVIIHCREATEIILSILRSRKDLDIRGVFHAYSGSYETYRQILDLGDFRFGIGGVVTFKKASIAETVKKMDLKDIILETDCPYLTPAPHRGSRNESSYIPFIAEKIALQKGCSIGEVAETTTKNAEMLFNI